MYPDKLTDNMRKKGYEVIFFKTKEEATQYICGLFGGAVIGCGDSQTISKMDLYRLLSAKNTVFDPNQCEDNESFLTTARKALMADYFFTSVNAVTEDGVIINLDGTGNRVAGSLFGHKKVFYVFGTNKISKNIEEGVWRTRNIAAPLNAKRLNHKTPCAVRGDKCYDCKSSERICNGLLIQYRKMNDMEAEAIIIDEAMGF